MLSCSSEADGDRSRALLGGGAEVRADREGPAPARSQCKLDSLERGPRGRLSFLIFLKQSSTGPS